MHWVNIFLILFCFTLLWRRGITYFILVVIDWQRKNVPSLFESGQEPIGCSLGGYNLSSFISPIGKISRTLINTVFTALIIWSSFKLFDFVTWLLVLIGALTILSWLFVEAIILLPAEKFAPIISKLPASLTTSKKSHRNWIFVFFGMALTGYFFIGLCLLIAWLSF